MKRLFIISVVLLFSISIAVNGSNEAGKTTKKIKDGWVSSNIFRVYVIGNPEPGLIDKAERRDSAKRAAMSKAWKKVIAKFVKERISAAKDPADYSSAGHLIAKKYKYWVREGKIINIRYGKDDSCEIIYQVEAKDLREKVRGTY